MFLVGIDFSRFLEEKNVSMAWLDGTSSHRVWSPFSTSVFVTAPGGQDSILFGSTMFPFVPLYPELPKRMHHFGTTPMNQPLHKSTSNLHKTSQKKLTDERQRPLIPLRRPLPAGRNWGCYLNVRFLPSNKESLSIERTWKKPWHCCLYSWDALFLRKWKPWGKRRFSEQTRTTLLGLWLFPHSFWLWQDGVAVIIVKQPFEKVHIWKTKTQHSVYIGDNGNDVPVISPSEDHDENNRWGSV